jgi:hypothetical protein
VDFREFTYNSVYTQKKAKSDSSVVGQDERVCTKKKAPAEAGAVELLVTEPSVSELNDARELHASRTTTPQERIANADVTSGT